MKPQKAYPIIDFSDEPGKTNIRLIDSPVNRKKNSKRMKNDSLFTFRVNDRKFENLLRNSIRNIIIEEFRLVMNEDKKQVNECYLFAKEDFPILMLNNFRPLTAKETEVMDLVLLCFTNRKIGARLNMTLNTVKNHMKNILSKLGVKDRIAACTVYRKLYNKPEMLLK
jgi:ATP/maltotriose-dependent transcriptional regulator MalT